MNSDLPAERPVNSCTSYKRDYVNYHICLETHGTADDCMTSYSSLDD